MALEAPPLRLRVAVGRYPHLAALRDGSIRVEGVALDFIEVDPIGNAFPAMCRDLAYDVSEMSITAYLSARVYRKGFTAIPVFPLRAFPQPHSALSVRAGGEIVDPKQLEGRRVAERAYARTVGLWVRGILAHEYGVDPDRITWVGVEAEHVAEFTPDAPPNVERRLGADMAALVTQGEAAAAVTVSGAGIVPLIPGARGAAVDYFRRSGVYQINHTIVVRDALIERDPHLPHQLYEAFAAAKAAWLASGPDTTPAAELGLPGNDPLPYGIAANRATLDALVSFAHEQHITPLRMTIAELFPGFGT
jgi:4,5-dihydroxyphthalate decarboxylase